jgi:hypothetical protein
MSTAPLFKEERNISGLTLIADRYDPIGSDWPRSRAAFAANDHPRNPVQIDSAYILQKRLYR